MQHYNSFIFVLLFILGTHSVLAIPPLAKKYKTSCVTCHYAYPKLNSFGKCIKNNGLRYPKDEEDEMTKEEPIELGDEAYKRVFPKAIWPGSIPGHSPFGLQGIGRLHYRNLEQLKKSFFFEIPHEVKLIFGGTMGDKFSIFGNLDYLHRSVFSYFFVFNWDIIPAVHIKLGSIGPNFSIERHKITIEPYSLSSLQNQSATWSLNQGAGSGIELWGAGNGFKNRGGFTYAVGFGNGQRDMLNFDINKEKDFYVQGTFKFGGLGEIGGSSSEKEQSVETNPHVDNSFKISGFYYNGKATKEEYLDAFNVFGSTMETWISIANISASAMVLQSHYQDTTKKSLAFFTEAQLAVYPWLIGYTRFESVTKDTEDKDTDTELNLLPGFVALLHANIKVSLEYRIPLDEERKGKGKDRGTIQLDFAL